MRDTWNDVAKYVKKKAKTNLDDKIAKVRKERKTGDNDMEEEDEAGSEDSSDEELSDEVFHKNS